MKRTLLIAALLILAAPAAASACSCVMPGKPRQEVRQADAAAFVKVVKRTALGARGPYAFNDDIRYTLRVLRDYKRNLPSKFTLTVNRSSAACGIDVRKGRKLGLLLERRRNGDFTASLCSIRSRKHLEAGATRKQEGASAVQALAC